MKISFIFLFSIFFTNLWAQPQDMDLVKGKLENGLTYYVKKGVMQKGKADFYLIQNVGALMENDEQNGLAHFLEHMAFNGTVNFPTGVTAFLTKHGVTNYNAYTGPDETVYHINNVPVTNQNLVDSCVLILRDWSGFLLLDDREINKERGVILEERRSTRNAVTEMQDLANNTIYNGSKYAVHNVIGRVDVIENFKPELLRAFYHDFYRPDQQAVVIVGDIDPLQVEAKIKELFAPIPRRVNPKPREVFGIADNLKPMYCHVSIKDSEDNSITTMIRVKDEPFTTLEKLLKFNLYKSFYNKLMADRLRAYVDESDAAFAQMMVEYAPQVRGYSSFMVMVKPEIGREQEAYLEVMREIERVHRLGFTAQEVENKKAEFMAKIEKGKSGSNLLPNSSYMTIYKNNFLLGYPITDVAEDNALTEKVLKEMTSEDLSQWIAGWYNQEKNNIYIVNSPVGVTNYASLEDLIAIRKKVKEMDLKPRKEPEQISGLIDFEIKGGSVVSKKDMKPLGMQLWTLSNGAKLYFKKTNAEKGKVMLLGESLGGKSLLEPKDLPSAFPINTLTLYSGVYNHTGRQIRDYLKGKTIAVSMNLGETSESLSGSSSCADADDLFTLIYLLFEKPRFDKAVFEKYVSQQKQRIAEYKRQPMDDVKDEMNALTLKESPRRMKIDRSFYDRMSFERMAEIYRERFSNAADFTFYLSGDISDEEAERLVAKYLAPIPSTKVREKHIVHDTQIHQSITKDFMVEMPEPKYVIDIEYENSYKLNRKEQLLFEALGYILNTRYNQQIREDEGGTYGVNVTTNLSEFPMPMQSLCISFETSMEKGDYLRMLVHKQLNTVLNVGITQDELDDFVKIMKRNRETMKRTPTNNYYIDAMRAYVDTKVDVTSDSYFENVIDTIKPEDVSAFLKKFLHKAECSDIVIKAKI